MSDPNYDERYDEAYKDFDPDGAKVFTKNPEILEALGIDRKNDDTVFGVGWVYCASHRNTHKTGWCTVSIVNKRPLRATTFEDARSEAETLIGKDRLIA